jgi:dTDP-4-amino-4,6-dideoxy-D-glucose acyltransferase
MKYIQKIIINMVSFYTEEELKNLNFKSIGNNCLISRNAIFYNISKITIGNNTRIDDFCVISAGDGGIEIGSYIHISVFVSIQGNGKIKIGDYSTLSSKTSIYSSNDDYLGEFMTNPMVPKKYTNVTEADVIIKKHVIVGSGSIILPGVTLNDGVAIGSLSLVKKDCEEFCIYFGTPCKKIGERSRNLLKLESYFINQL